MDFNFNGWGEKFEYKLDNLITSNLYDLLNNINNHNNFSNYKLENIDFILEGGSIESNGTGTILTTSNCVFNNNRNLNNKLNNNLDKNIKTLIIPA